MELNNANLKHLYLKLYSNPELRERFLANPEDVLKEEGFSVPDDVEIQAFAETATRKYLVLPFISMEENLKPEELEPRLSKVLM